MPIPSKHKVRRAQERLQAGDPHGARLLCNEILTRCPRHEEALALLGITHIVEGDAASALGVFDQVLRVSPRNGFAIFATHYHCQAAKLKLRTTRK